MDRHTLTRNIRQIIIDAEIVEITLPLCPEITLCLISPDNKKRQFSADETRLIQHRTPYWSFCWASGQAMAWYLLKNRSQFEGKTVLDFGSGSGVVAIAAAIAGTSEVTACDSDTNALDAIEVNSSLNGVTVKTCKSLNNISHSRYDIVITADVLYDPDNFYLLKKFFYYAPKVFVADSRLKSIDVIPYRKIDQITTTTIPDLHEGDEFNHVNIYLGQANTINKLPCKAGIGGRGKG